MPHYDIENGQGGARPMAAPDQGGRGMSPGFAEGDSQSGSPGDGGGATGIGVAGDGRGMPTLPGPSGRRTPGGDGGPMAFGRDTGGFGIPADSRGAPVVGSRSETSPAPSRTTEVGGQ